MAIDAGKVVAMLELDSSGFSGSLSSAQKLLKTWGSDTVSLSDKLGATGKAVSGLGKTMSTALTLPIIGLGTAAVTTFTSFDDAMRQVRATMNASEEDTEKLTAAAKEMGATTRYSASESASALNYLALAGYNADQAVTALPTVLRLAQAGGLDLAYASDLVTDSMSALGMEMGELTGFADQMAVASQKSNTSVGQLGEAILTVGGTAKALAGGTVELNTALGILADQGIKGAEGGTHLRNIILSLQTPTKDGAAAIEKYTRGVYDAEGNMRSLDVVMGELKESMKSMTSAEQQNVLSAIFNKTDLAAAQALLAGTGERFAELSGYIENSAGAAETMAEVMEGGIGGAFRNFKSAVEGLAIEFGEKLAPTVQKVADFITNLTRRFTELPDGMQQTIIKIAAFTAAAGPLLMVGGKVVAMVGTLSKAWGLLASPAGGVGLAIAGVAGLIVMIEKLNQKKITPGISTAELEKYKLEDIDLGTQNAEFELNIQQKGKTAYEQIIDILNDGKPETEQEQLMMVDSVNAIIDDSMAAIEANYQTKAANLKELLKAGVIDEAEYNRRTAELTANTEATKAALQGDAKEVTDYVAALVAANAPMTEEQIAYLQTLIDKLVETSEAAGVASDAALSGYRMAFERTAGGYGVEGDTQKAATYVETMYKQRVADAQAQMQEDQAGFAADAAQYAEGSDEWNAVMADSAANIDHWNEVIEGYGRERKAMYAEIAGGQVEDGSELDATLEKLKELFDRRDELKKQGATGARHGSNGEMGYWFESAADEELYNVREEIDALQKSIDDTDLQKIKDVMGYMFAGDENADATKLETMTGVLNAYLDVMDSVDEAGAGVADGMDDMATSIETRSDEAADSVKRMPTKILNDGQTVAEMATAGQDLGENFAGGVPIGVLLKMPEIQSSIDQMTAAMVYRAEHNLGISSPSKVMRRLGAFTSEGFALGIADNETLVRHAAEHMAGAATGAATTGGGGTTAAARGTAVTLNLNGAVIRSDEDARTLARQLGAYVNAMNYGV